MGFDEILCMGVIWCDLGYGMVFISISWPGKRRECTRSECVCTCVRN